MGLLAYNNIFLDPRYATVVYTDQGATFDSDYPLSNLSKMQLPTFAQFTGATCDLDADAGASYSVKVLALLGHTLTSGMEVEFLNGMSSLGTVTVANYEGAAQNAILVLDSPVSLQTLTIQVTGGSGGTDYRIGALWASPALSLDIESRDFGFGTASLSTAGYADGTGYTKAMESYDNPSLSFTVMSESQAIGPAYPNLKAIFRQSGLHRPVISIPLESELAFSTYGLMSDMSGPSIREGQLWKASATIREQR